jgi:hypothetical protein
MASSSHGISSQVSSGGDAAEAPCTTAEPRAELLDGVDAEAALKGVDKRSLVWIGDLSFQGRSVEEVE